MSSFSVSCPNCSAKIRRKDLKDTFHCRACGTALASNRTKARWVLFVICVVALPLMLFAGQKIALFIFGSDADFSDKQLVVFFLYIGLILLVYP
ncbi:MAG: transposase family protein, partial [Bacteroidota bacterium]